MQIEFDGHCFGCGPLSEEGLRMVFTPGPDGSFCELTLPRKFQSWAGMTHGGIVSLMLDEAVGWAAWHDGHPGVTGRLEVSLRRPLKLGEQVRIVGKVDHVRRSLVYVNAFVENRDDHSRVADATATLMQVKAVVDPAAR